jgi:hypothetical protein
VTVQIHCRKKAFKGVKMTTAKWSINIIGEQQELRYQIIGEQQELRYLAARFNEKGCLPVRGGDALTLLLDPNL